MQFSVIVEGPMENNAYDEDAWQELERFLCSSGIPGHVLQHLQKGQPQVLKNELTYEQAVSISDRLMDLGLDSIIDPPIKPDDDAVDEPPKTNQSKVTPIKRQSQPAQAKAHSGSKAARQSKDTVNGRSRIRKPALAVVKTKDKNNHQRQVPKMATVDGKPSATQQKPSQAMKSKTSKAVTGQPSAATKTKRPASNAKAAATPLAKAAAEVKALFQLPKNGQVEITPPIAARIKMLAGASACVLAPTIYVVSWLAVLTLSLSLAVSLYAVAGFLLAPIPVLLVAGLFSLAHLPYFFARHTQTPSLELRAKDEPRLFMLVSAIGKVLKTPTVNSLSLNDSTKVSAQQHCSAKEFLRVKEPLEGEIKLTIGADLLRCLTVRDLSSLLAKELAVYAHPQLRRPCWLTRTVMADLRFWATQHDELQQRLRDIHDNTGIDFLQKIVSLIASLSDRCHAGASAYFELCERWLKACLGAANALGAANQQVFLGNYDREEVLETLIHIDANHEQARLDMLDNDTGRYVNNLMAYTEHLLQKNKEETSEPKPTNGIIVSTAPAHRLVAHTEAYEQALTRKVYQHAGLEPDQLELCSLQSLFKHEAKDQKFTQAAQEYFIDWLHPLQFWRLPAENLLPQNDKSTVVTRLNNCIARIRYVAPDRQAWLQRYDKFLKQLAELKAAKKIHASGNKFEFQRCADAARNLEPELSQRLAQTKQAQVELRQHNAIMGERLALGLSLNQQQKELSNKLYQALATCSAIADKAIIVVNDIEELHHILRHKPKHQAQQFQLYVRELSQRINENEKAIRKRLMHCPYDMIDRRYPTMAQFVSAQQNKHDSLNLSHEQLIVHKAKDTLAAINWAYKQINQRAAFIAGAMEKQFGVEKVKRLEKTG